MGSLDFSNEEDVDLWVDGRGVCGELCRRGSSDFMGVGFPGLNEVPISLRKIQIFL